MHTRKCTVSLFIVVNLFSGYLKTHFNSIRYVASNLSIIVVDELDKMWKENRPFHVYRLFVCLEKLRKPKKFLSHDSGPPG